MELSQAHIDYASRQEFEWQRWARAFAQLKQAIDQHFEGVLPADKLYNTIDAIEMVLAAMINVRPETLHVILHVAAEKWNDGHVWPIVDPDKRPGFNG